MANKIMLLIVTGGAGEYTVGPWQRIVSVPDEIEFISTMRAVALKELITAINLNQVPEDMQAALLKSLKVKLVDTGLSAYPESEAEQVALYKRMNEPEEILE
jgi:hypothetical protein